MHVHGPDVRCPDGSRHAHSQHACCHRKLGSTISGNCDTTRAEDAELQTESASEEAGLPVEGLRVRFLTRALCREVEQQPEASRGSGSGV